MKMRFLILLIGFFFFVFFYIFSWQVKQEQFKKINFDVTSRLQYKISSRFEEIFEDVSFFVSPLLSVGLVGLLTSIALVDIKKKKIHWNAAIIPIAFAVLVGIEIYGKERVESPAPPHFMIKNPTTIFPKYYIQDQYSYPSGHAARSLFIGGVASLIFFEKIKKRKALSLLFFVLCILFSVFVSVGKIYLGQHWFSDIIGGWILAMATLLLSMGLYGLHE